MATVSHTADDPWTTAMRAGDFATAWRINDAVLARRVARGERCMHAPRHCQFIWRGTPLAGRRVLVRCYHGLGDTLQFVRFAAPLARVARHNVFWVQPALLGLVSGVAGVQEVLPLHDGDPGIHYDVDVEIMELPHALRVSGDSLGTCVPYLPGAPAGPRRRAAGEPLRVGLAWMAGDWNPRRSLGVNELNGFAPIPGVELYSLQYPPVECPFEGLACADIGELARRIATLDLVVSVDTMVAHLAGGLGLATWTLLAHDCDWRWMAQRDDTPWYPGMRLYRQRVPGDWSEVIARVRSDLAARAGEGS
jgi:hypothetical protein